jgi:hypothetical protein
VDEVFDGMHVSVRYDAEKQVFEFHAPPEVTVIEGFWFAWSAFHPDTTVFVARPSAGAERRDAGHGDRGGKGGSP